VNSVERILNYDVAVGATLAKATSLLLRGRTRAAVEHARRGYREAHMAYVRAAPAEERQRWNAMVIRARASREGRR
jgi:hypothetical protein